MSVCACLICVLLGLMWYSAPRWIIIAFISQRSCVFITDKSANIQLIVTGFRYSGFHQYLPQFPSYEYHAIHRWILFCENVRIREASSWLLPAPTWSMLCLSSISLVVTIPAHQALFMWLFANVSIKELSARSVFKKAIFPVFALNRIVLSCLSRSLVEKGLSRFPKIIHLFSLHSGIVRTGLKKCAASVVSPDNNANERVYHSFLFHAPIDLLSIISPINTIVCVLFFTGCVVVLHALGCVSCVSGCSVVSWEECVEMVCELPPVVLRGGRKSNMKDMTVARSVDRKYLL